MRADKGRLQDCDIGDRDGRRENIGKPLKVRSAFAFNQFADDLLRQSCRCSPCSNVCNLDLDLSLIHGCYLVGLGISDASPGEFG